jgi:hypothetical protein
MTTSGFYTSRGVSSLEGLTDVAISNPTAGQILTYVAASSSPVAPAKWVNQNAPSGGAAAPVFPRAGAGPWQVWTASYGLSPSINGNYQSLGGVGGAMYYFGANQYFPVISLLSYGGGQSAFAGGYSGAWSVKPYLKCRASVLGYNGYSNPQNTTFRMWLGFGENATAANVYDTAMPIGEFLYAFRYSTDVDSTIKCVVTSPFAGASGYAPAQIIDTHITPDSNFHDFVIYFDATHVYFQIDGVLVGTVLLSGNPAGLFWPNYYYATPFAFVQGLPGSGSPATTPYAYLLCEYIYVDFPLL